VKSSLRLCAFFVALREIFFAFATLLWSNHPAGNNIVPADGGSFRFSIRQT
jgi:hypothetical protein